MNIKSTILCLAIGLMGTQAFADAAVDKKCSDEVQKRAGKFKTQLFKDVGACLSAIRGCNLLSGGDVQTCKEELIDTSLKAKAKCSSYAIDGGNLLFGPGSSAASATLGIKAKSAKALNLLVKNVDKKCFVAGADLSLSGLGYGTPASAQALIDSLNGMVDPTGYACKELDSLNVTVPKMAELLQDLITLDDNSANPNHVLSPTLRVSADPFNAGNDCSIVPL